MVVGAVVDAISRIARARRTRGPWGAARVALERVKPRPRFAADYVWFLLDLTQDTRPRPALPDGFELRAGTLGDLAAIQELDHELVSTMTKRLMRDRLARGATPWLVVAPDGRLACYTWSFEGSLPVHGDHRLTLPDGVVGFEDAVTSAAFRGRRIAPATWSAVGTRLVERGAYAIVGRVDVLNESSVRACGAAGYVERARMRVVWRDWRILVQVALPPGDESHAWLRDVNRAGPRLRRC
jgi:hypothetical protein